MKGAHIAEEEPAFPAVFASYIGFSWLGSCMVSRETCFFHLLRHASPLRWPECFHLSQLSSGMLLKVLSVFWETQLLIWDAYPINLCLVQKILLKPLLKKKFPWIPVPVSISGCCLSVGCSAWAGGCTVNCSRTDGFGLSSWGRVQWHLLVSVLMELDSSPAPTLLGLDSLYPYTAAFLCVSSCSYFSKLAFGQTVSTFCSRFEAFYLC